MYPVLFRIPGLDWDVQAYGFFMGLALIVGWLLALAGARRDQLPPDPLGTNYILSVALGLVAARTGWLLQDPSRIEGWQSFIQLQAGGLAGFAGVVIAAFASAMLCQRKRIPVLPWLDVVSPAFAVGLALERVGALLAGTGYGRYVDPTFALAIRFPEGSPAHADHVARLATLMGPGVTGSLPVHPTQLYGLVLALGALGLCLWMRRRRSFSGQVFLAMAMYVLIARTFVEGAFRADADPAAVGPLSLAQVVAIILVGVMGMVYRGRRTRAAKDPSALRQWTGGPWTPKPS